MASIHAHLLKNLPCTLQKSYLLDVFTITDLPAVLEMDGSLYVQLATEPYQGRLIDYKGMIHQITTFERTAYRE